MALSVHHHGIAKPLQIDSSLKLDTSQVLMRPLLPPDLLGCSQLKFGELTELFHHCELCKRQPGKKVSDALRLFVNSRLPEKSDDFFQILRLMLPQATTHRFSPADAQPSG